MQYLGSLSEVVFDLDSGATCEAAVGVGVFGSYDVLT